MDEILKKKLIELARREAACDIEDFNPYDNSGGNFDDAFSMGIDEGRILLAREILDLICIKY